MHELFVSDAKHFVSMSIVFYKPLLSLSECFFKIITDLITDIG